MILHTSTHTIKEWGGMTLHISTRPTKECAG